MATEVELVYKGWLKKSTVADPTKRKSSFLGRSSANWKKKYFLLLKRTEEDDTDIPYLEYHEKECTAEAENPKGSLKLWPDYRVEKKHDASGKTFVFDVKTPEETYKLQAESETIMDLWVFYLQIQTKLRPDFPGHFFEVTPDDSDPMRRIGAKGSKCLLHISPWGVTLALKRTKSLLAQWPLTCIREFESSETGAFSMDAGRSAPMGEAQYIFRTGHGQDGQMYDLLDDYTTKLIERQQKENPSSPPQPASEEEVAQEYIRFRQATFGLLPGTKPRAASLSTPPSASVAVPVPPTRGPPQRPLRQPLQELPATPSSQLGHSVSQPVLGKERPPLPPRNHPPLREPQSSASALIQQTYASPYDHEDTATLEGAVGGAVGGTSRASATESDMMRFSQSSGSAGSQHYGARQFQHRHSNPAVRSPYEDMKSSLHVPSFYENTARLSYPSSSEHSAGISISPQDMMWGGFANPGFIASPQQASPQSLSKSPWYHEIRGSYGNSVMPRTEIMHTYLDPRFGQDTTGATHYASPPKQSPGHVPAPQAIPQAGSLKRSLSFDNIFDRLSISSSGIGSPLLHTLDLANSMTYASPRLSVGLPKTPSHTGLPPDFNMYIGTPSRTMTKVSFPQSAGATGQDIIEYEKMANQKLQSSNNNNQGTVPSGGHHMQHNPPARNSAPLAMVSGLIPAADGHYMQHNPPARHSAPLAMASGSIPAAGGHYMHHNPHAMQSAPLAMASGSIPAANGHYMQHNPLPMRSEPLAMVSGMIPAAGAKFQPTMKRSRSEADLLNCKKLQESGYMTMEDRANLFAGYMDMEKGYLAKLKKAAVEAAKKKSQEKSSLGENNGGVSLQTSGSSHYMIPRSVEVPQQTMTDQEMQQSIQVYGTTDRKKSRFKMSKLFKSQKAAGSDEDSRSGSESPSQSPRKYKKSPSQVLLDKMKRSPKKDERQRKMVRSRSEADLRNIANPNSGYMDMRKGSVGSQGQLRRANSDFDLLDDNSSTTSGDSIAVDTPEGIVYFNRKRFQSTPDVLGNHHIPVPTPQGNHGATNGTAVKPASHSVPTNAPIKKKKFPLKMFRQSNKGKWEESEGSPNISSTESSPDMSRALKVTQGSPPKPASKPKLSKLKIPNKSSSVDSGIVASDKFKSFVKRKSVDKPAEGGNTTFYLSSDHETVTELTHRPLPSLPRGVAPPHTSQPESSFPQVKPPTPVMPSPQIARSRDYQEINDKEVGRQKIAQRQDVQYIEEYMPTGEQQRRSLSSSGGASQLSGAPVDVAPRRAKRPKPIPPPRQDINTASDLGVDLVEDEEKAQQRRSASKIASLV